MKKDRTKISTTIWRPVINIGVLGGTAEKGLRLAQDSGHVASGHGEGKVVKGYGKGKRPFPPCY